MGRSFAAGLVSLVVAMAVAPGSSALGEEPRRPTRPCDTPEGKQFDFWLGEWTLTWPAEQTRGAAGRTASGTNRVRRILEGCVIEESFAFPAGRFFGRSVSAYDRATGEWRQTWVDSNGTYLTFRGRFEGGRMVLTSDPVERDGRTVVTRMVFRDIERDSLSWDWQRSDDGGETWVDVWNINYRRAR